VLCHTEVRELRGGDTLEEVLVEDRNSGQRRTLPARALFVFIGAEPHTAWLAGQLALDQQGYIRTGGPTLLDGRPPAELETSWAGVFSAGDVRSGSVKRMASAVGEGAMAIRMVHDFLAAAHVTHA
jgi:thioredoxin reductase (NADPH)